MNKVIGRILLAGAVAFLLSDTSISGVPISPTKPLPGSTSASDAGLRPVVIVSRPQGAKITINGQYVGKAPVLIDVAVDRLGRPVRSLQIAATAQRPGAFDEARHFSASGTPGSAGSIPSVIYFDLYVHPVFAIR